MSSFSSRCRLGMAISLPAWSASLPLHAFSPLPYIRECPVHFQLNRKRRSNGLRELDFLGFKQHDPSCDDEVGNAKR